MLARMFLNFMLLLLLFNVNGQNNEEEWSQKVTTTRFSLDTDLFRVSYIPNSDTKITQINWDKNPIKPEHFQALLSQKDLIGSTILEITGFDYVFETKANQNSENLTFDNQKNHKLSKLVELVFPLNGTIPQIIELYNDTATNDNFTSLIGRFKLEFLNASSMGLEDHHLETYGPNSSYAHLKDSEWFSLILKRYFAMIRVLQLSANKLSNLNPSHFELFSGDERHPSMMEAILLNSNQITFIRHDTFYALKKLKYIDLSNNKLKMIHPLTFMHSIHLYTLKLSNNKLKAIYNTPKADSELITGFINFNATKLNSTRSLPDLRNLYLNGNDEIECDCGLLWLYKIKNEINFRDQFKCKKWNKMYEFSAIGSESFLTDGSEMPSLVVDVTDFEKSSEITLFRSLAKRWFAWNLFFDVLPVTTPAPYLWTETSLDTVADPGNEKSDLALREKISNLPKNVFHVWHGSDAVFKCNVNATTSTNGSSSSETKSTIIWKTQYGYLSHMDNDLLDVFNYDLENTSARYNSFKIFYKMNKLTRIHKNITVTISQRLGGKSISHFYVNAQNELVVTQMRQIVSGEFVCIAINERGIDMYEYDMEIRTGVAEFFIYSLFISLFSMVVPSVIGIIVCCVCEYQAEKNYPMTPPCYPTPQAQTPPNLDWAEWMANAASYLPNLNIHDTLEQVSKKLRKGMEKASVTVKSLGLTSTAYIYSVYEQSTNRWNDIKNYVPSLNVPSLNLPTMRYPPVGQLGRRMRIGMDNIFIQMKEFCGHSDLIHSASIVDIENDTNASNAVGKTYIMDQFDLKKKNNEATMINHQNYFRFLHLIREESKKQLQQRQQQQKQQQQQQQLNNGDLAETPVSTLTTLSFQINDENAPTTSAQAAVTDTITIEHNVAPAGSNMSSQRAPTLVVKIVRQEMIGKYSEEAAAAEADNDDSDEEDEDDDQPEFNKSLKSSKSGSSTTTSSLTNNESVDGSGEERTSKLEPSMNHMIKKSIEKI